MSSDGPHPLLSELKSGLGPSADQARVLAERLGKSVGASLTPPLEPSAPLAAGVVAGTKTALGVKVFLGLLIAGGAGYGVHVSSREHPAPSPMHEMSVVAATSASSTAAAPSTSTTPSAEVTLAEVPTLAEPVAAHHEPKPPIASASHAGARPRASAEIAPTPEPTAPDEPTPTESTVLTADAARAAERALIDEARHALLGNDGGRALASLSQHRQRFPHGTLREEREALNVSALAAAGRTEEARAARSRFEATWPKSLFLSAVRAAAP